MGRKKGSLSKTKQPHSLQNNVEGKHCTSCKKWKPLMDFGKHTISKDGLNYYCQECAKKQVEDIHKSPDGIKKRKDYYENIYKPQHRSLHLKKSFGITTKDYDDMLKTQNNCCAICKAVVPHPNRPHFDVDHSHETGKIRGLLCNRCNRVLGLIKDDKNLLSSMLIYLQKN